MPKKVSTPKSVIDKPIKEVSRPTPQRSRNDDSSLGFMILGIIAVVVALCVAGYFVYASYFSNQGKSSDDLSASENYQVPMGVTVPSETASQTNQDPTVGWLSYGLPIYSTSSASSTAGTSSSTSSSSAPVVAVAGKAFNFLYPANFKIEEGKKGLRMFSDEVTSTQVTVNWADSKKPLTQYVSELDEISKTAWEGKPSIEIVTSTASAVIAGLPAVVRQQKSLSADLEQFVVYIKNNDKIYTISLMAPKLDTNLGQFFSIFLSKFNFAK